MFFSTKRFSITSIGTSSRSSEVVGNWVCWIGKYVKVTVLDCLIIGIESYILFSYLKLPYLQLFALIIGIGNLIPFIGPFIGLVPVLTYAITQSWSLFLIILVVVTILQAIEANVVKPLLTSKSVDIHPITTLLTVLVGGSLLGIPGAFLAIPAYMIIKLSIQFLYNKHEEKEKIVDRN